MLAKQMCGALLLVICSTPGTFANKTQPHKNFTTFVNDTKNAAPAHNNLTTILEAIENDAKNATNATLPGASDESVNILRKIHRTVTRSKDAVWATITLTFVCVLLLLSVAQSRMWKDHRMVESSGVPLPDFNERVLFKDVMEHKLKSLKRLFKKKEKEPPTEMKSLLASSGSDDEDTP